MGAETALLAAAIGVEVLGGVQQAQAAEAVGDANERAAQINAAVAQREAAFSEQQRRRETRRILARGRALAGSSGLTPTGSFLDVTGASAEQAEIAALAIRYGGRSEADRFLNQGEMAQFEAKQAKNAAILGTLGTVFGGAAALKTFGQFGGGGGTAAGGTAAAGGPRRLFPQDLYKAGQFNTGTGRMYGSGVY